MSWSANAIAAPATAESKSGRGVKMGVLPRSKKLSTGPLGQACRPGHPCRGPSGRCRSSVAMRRPAPAGRRKAARQRRVRVGRPSRSPTSGSSSTELMLGRPGRRPTPASETASCRARSARRARARRLAATYRPAQVDDHLGIAASARRMSPRRTGPGDADVAAPAPGDHEIQDGHPENRERDGAGAGPRPLESSPDSALPPGRVLGGGRATQALMSRSCGPAPGTAARASRRHGPSVYVFPPSRPPRPGTRVGGGLQGRDQAIAVGRVDVDGRSLR